MTPDATGQTFTVTDYKRAIDVASGRVRIEQTRTPNFTFFQGQQPQKQVFGVDGAVAYNVAAERQRDARGRCRREGPAGGELPPPDHHHSRGARSRRQAVEPEDPGQPERRGHHDRRRPHVHAGDRQHDEAADPRRLDDRQHQPRRRRDRDELRRLSGCQRAQTPRPPDNEDRQVHDRRAAGDETGRRRRYRRSGGACRRRIRCGARRSSRRWSPSRKSRLASGGSPAGAITASSSSSRTT